MYTTVAMNNKDEKEKIFPLQKESRQAITRQNVGHSFTIISSRSRFAPRVYRKKNKYIYIQRNPTAVARSPSSKKLSGFMTPFGVPGERPKKERKKKKKLEAKLADAIHITRSRLRATVTSLFLRARTALHFSHSPIAHSAFFQP